MDRYLEITPISNNKVGIRFDKGEGRKAKSNPFCKLITSVNPCVYNNYKIKKE